MEHVAIMTKTLGMIPKILGGDKTIESRWLNQKSAPWNKVKVGDTVYFKNAGEKVTTKAEVSDVIQVEDLDDTKVGIILTRYHKELGVTESEIGRFFKDWKDKKYVVLIWLEDVEEVAPFDVDKTGQGLMSAWLSVDSIDQIKK